MALSDITKSAVRSAMDEYDRLGREAFLSKYGFGKARSYFLVFRRKHYDSKAIAGAAHGYAFPNEGALGPYHFGGGENATARVLRNLGYKVEESKPPSKTVSAKKRNPIWSRDELILALDFYIRHRERTPGKESPEIAKLSQEINAVAAFLGHAPSETLRNINGVYMKMMNFRSHDPAYTGSGRKGLTRGNKDEAVVWKQFADDKPRLHQVAEAIRARIAEKAPDGIETPEVDDPEIAEADEGRLVTRLHRTRERSRELVRKKKSEFLKTHGRVFCEACGFDFEEYYGERGAGYIECHHTQPLHTLRAGQKTKLVDLALLCANCHRMVHAKSRWLSVKELKRIVRAHWNES